MDNKCPYCKKEMKKGIIHSDRYNLKSALTQYIAIGALLDNHGEDLELFCNNKLDEPLFLNFFYNNPETA